MSTFRTALRVVAAHPIYLALYVVMLSLMGVLVLGDIDAAASADAGSYETYPARAAVVDRDGSALSGALAAWAGETYDLVEVADDTQALQDALATGAADCVLVLPAGFEADLLARARAGEDLAALEAAYGTDVQAGALAASAASRWVALAASAAALEPGADGEKVAELAAGAAEARAEVAVEASAQASGGTDRLVTYLNFSTYSLTSSIVVVAGCTLASFGRAELRRRNAAGPVPPLRLAAGALLACAVLALAVWAWTCGVALASCGGSLAGVDPALVAASLALVLVLALVPLALAFLLAQVGLDEDAINAVGNIGAMVMSFLGGAWVPLSMLPEAVRAAGRFVPAYWVSDAVTTLLHADALGPSELAVVGRAAGIVALFAVAIFALGAALGRSRRRVAGAA